MKEMLRLILVLTLTATLTGSLLAIANKWTEEPIQAARRADLLQALTVVLPEHDNEPDRDAITIEIETREHTFYPARCNGEFTGAAFTSRAEGYGGSITVMIGVDANDDIHAIHILNHQETPGLGANIANPEFTGQFSGQDAADGKTALRREGGNIEAVTAATVSSEAVTEAVNKGLNRYLMHRETIRAEK